MICMVKAEKELEVNKEHCIFTGTLCSHISTTVTFGGRRDTGQVNGAMVGTKFGPRTAERDLQVVTDLKRYAADLGFHGPSMHKK